MDLRPCTICDTMINTRLAIQGSGEWFCAVMEVMGLAPKLARSLLHTILEEHAPYGTAKVMSKGTIKIPADQTYVLLMCERCATKAHMTVSATEQVPCYKEPAL